MKRLKKNGHVVVNPRIMLGKPVVKGTRIPVYVVLDLLGEGLNIREIRRQYPDLTKDDILACMRYAARLAAFEELPAATRHG